MTEPEDDSVDTTADGTFPEPVEPPAPVEDDEDPELLAGAELSEEEVNRALPEDSVEE